MLFSAIWDADGNFIELNKLLGSAAGMDKPADAAADTRPKDAKELRERLQ